MPGTDEFRALCVIAGAVVFAIIISIVKKIVWKRRENSAAK